MKCEHVSCKDQLTAIALSERKDAPKWLWESSGLLGAGDMDMLERVQMSSRRRRSLHPRDDGGNKDDINGARRGAITCG